MAAAENKSDFKLTSDTPYLALTGSDGVFIASISEKIDCVITASYSVTFQDSGNLFNTR